MGETREHTFRTYRGLRPTNSNPGGDCYVEVYRDGRFLYHLHHVSADNTKGFEWGDCGAGPHDLALSLLADVTGMHEALTHHAGFTKEVVSGLPRDVDPDQDADYSAEWEIDEAEILGWLAGRSPAA
jgi:hypothetical protein